MPLIDNKPTSPGRRFSQRPDRRHLHNGSGYKPLLRKHKSSGGRNNYGRISVRHRGGGHKRLYREIDFLRRKDNIEAQVVRLEYDPNRSAHLALLKYRDGDYRYIIAPQKIALGDKVISGENVEIAHGNAMPLIHIPLGSSIYCIEMKPGKGAQLARSAGVGARLVDRIGSYATVRLSSGEVRQVPSACRATLGSVSNSEHNLRQLGKAGANRWRGRRPTVRGVAMNPIDHPHGGGEGRSSGGRHPVTPWGVPTKGYKTRHTRRTDSMIIRRGKKRR